MDALGVFWLVSYSVIGIIAIIKLKSTSTRNQHNGDDDKSERVNSITEVQKRSRSRAVVSQTTSNRCCNCGDKKASNDSKENSLPHS